MHKYAGIARQLPQTARQLSQDPHQLTIELEILRKTRNKITFGERKRLIVYCCYLEKMRHPLLHSLLLRPRPRALALAHGTASASRAWIQPMGLGSYSQGPGALARAWGLEPRPLGPRSGSQGPEAETRPWRMTPDPMGQSQDLGAGRGT